MIVFPSLLATDMATPMLDTVESKAALQALPRFAGTALVQTSPPNTERTIDPPPPPPSQSQPAVRPAVQGGVQPGTIFRVETTAYSSTPDQTWGDPFITASGVRVHDGVIAANFLPIGTRVRFHEYRPDMVFTVYDRMARRYSSRADIWMTSREAALQFGKRNLTMEVVE